MCLGPLTAYRSSEIGSSGRRPLVFVRKGSFSGVKVMVPCGQCMECRLEYSRQWATRCMNEKRMFSESSFITLTYAPTFLPQLQGPCIEKRGTLVLRDLQLFMKRLRVHPAFGNGVRFYAAGEYGERDARPHYHILLLSHDFPDKKFFANGKREGEFYYKSKILDELWPMGHHILGDVSFDSCAYVARYVTKKVTGKVSDSFYAGRLPEFCVMSRRPGIGHSYYMKYAHEIYAHDSLIVNGKEVRPPRFYDDRWKMLDPVGIVEIKRKRRLGFLARRDKAEETNRRRLVRETVKRARMTLGKATL